MTDDVKPEVIKKSQDLLGKYFKKPPLTEKLLKKPPFRFLHDIVSAVINETGFLDGLFTEEELNSEYIKNKEEKLIYLTKLIEVVKLATGINLTVRASKIISGQEATKTNELLQAIGKALDKKISSVEAIEQYKKNLEKGKSTSKSKSSVSKDEKRTLSKENPHRKTTTTKEKSTEHKKRTSNESNNSNTTTNEEKRKSENQEAEIKNIDATHVPQVESTQEGIVPLSAHRRKPSSTKLKQRTSSSLLSDTAVPSLIMDKKADESKKQKESENKSKQAGHAEVNESQSENQMFNTEAGNTNSLDSKSSINTKDTDNRINGSTQKEASIEKKESKIISNNEAPVQNVERSEQPISKSFETQRAPSENNDDSVPQTSSRPRTSLRPPSARPISARPAAPRIRGKTELMINEEILTPMGNVSVIVENSDLKDDDAEDMVVMETRGGGGDSLESSVNYKVDEQLTQEHGHLVAQILETQKELVNNENVDVIPKKTNIFWDTSSKRDVVAKEIEKLRNTIQTLTRATNPLGKLFDYFQEDVEIMQKELLEWRSQYQQVNEELEIEKLKTQELIEPMKETLKEIDHNMKMQLDKICQAKSQIMKNDQRIQTLLNGRL